VRNYTKYNIFGFFSSFYRFLWGEPLRCKTKAAPFYGAAFVLRLRRAIRSITFALRARWFRYYPSREMH